MKMGVMLPAMMSVELNEMAMRGVEALGMDSVWLPDHLLGPFHPDLWSAVPASGVLGDPDSYLDPFCVAAVLGRETGLAIGTNDELFVADTVNSRIAAVPDASDRSAALAGGGLTVASGGALNAPLGLTLAPNGDILTKCDFRAMAEFHRARAAALTVAVSLHQVEIPYGEFTLQGDRVVDLAEKPRKEFPVNAGIYLVDPSAIDLIPPGEYFDATDMIRALVDRGHVVAAHIIREYWLDVGRLPDLEKANRDVAAGLLD